MNPDLVPIITFVGKSGTGKTTLLEQLIPMLKARGLRLAVLKHDAHHFEMDKPGKDTYRFTAAGADVVTISNAEKFCHDRSSRRRSFLSGTSSPASPRWIWCSPRAIKEPLPQNRDSPGRAPPPPAGRSRRTVGHFNR